MAEYGIEDNGKRRVLSLSGELTIQNAEYVRSTLLEAMQSVEHLTVRIDGVTDVDLACLQILCAAHRSAAQRNVHLKLEKKGAEVFNQTAIYAGFLRHAGCAFDVGRECLWIEGGDHE